MRRAKSAYPNSKLNIVSKRFLPVQGRSVSALSRAIFHDISLLVLQSYCGDKPLLFQVFCPQNGTAVLKGHAGFRPYPEFEACVALNQDKAKVAIKQVQLPCPIPALSNT